jgi:hypothetical protein
MLDAISPRELHSVLAVTISDQMVALLLVASAAREALTDDA